MATSNDLEFSSRGGGTYPLQLYRSRLVHVLLVIAVGVSLLSIGAFYQAPKTPARASTIPISHIIFIVKENRSFDSMFGTFPGANGATTTLIPKAIFIL